MVRNIDWANAHCEAAARVVRRAARERPSGSWPCMVARMTRGERNARWSVECTEEKLVGNLRQRRTAKRRASGCAHVFALELERVGKVVDRRDLPLVEHPKPRHSPRDGPKNRTIGLELGRVRGFDLLASRDVREPNKPSRCIYGEYDPGKAQDEINKNAENKGCPMIVTHILADKFT